MAMVNLSFASLMRFVSCLADPDRPQQEVQLHLTEDERHHLLLVWMHLLKTLDVPTLRRWCAAGRAGPRMVLSCLWHDLCWRGCSCTSSLY